MTWSYSIARVAGIDVKLHVTFLLLVAFLGWQGYEAGGMDAAVMAIAFVTLLFLCVLLHEFGHAFAARAYGIRTPDITLLPIGGVARLERMPESPVQELVIAIAGPLVNVVIGAVLWLALGMPTRMDDDFLSSGMGDGLFPDLLRVNVMLVLFNLIPAFPMDGGRMLRALLAMGMSHLVATCIAARVGQVMAVILALVGWFGIPDWGVHQNFFLVFIAMFVFSGARQELAYAGMRAAVAGMHIADAMITQFKILSADMTASQAAHEASHDAQPIYPVTDAQLRPVGMISRNVLLKAESGSVGSLAQHIPTVRTDATFGEAFQLMQQSGSPVLPVVNPGGQLVGIVSMNLLSERARARNS
ncbi:MAG: M50 family metallopeptidase [Chthoniobacterales bacterium]